MGISRNKKKKGIFNGVCSAIGVWSGNIDAKVTNEFTKHIKINQFIINE